MKKKGKSYKVTHLYQQRLSAVNKTVYQRPPKWFKIIRILFLALLCTLCILAVIGYIKYYIHLVKDH